MTPQKRFAADSPLGHYYAAANHGCGYERLNTASPLHAGVEVWRDRNADVSVDAPAYLLVAKDGSYWEVEAGSEESHYLTFVTRVQEAERMAQLAYAQGERYWGAGNVPDVLKNAGRMEDDVVRDMTMFADELTPEGVALATELARRPVGPAHSVVFVDNAFSDSLRHQFPDDVKVVSTDFLPAPSKVLNADELAFYREMSAIQHDIGSGLCKPLPESGWNRHPAPGTLDGVPDLNVSPWVKPTDRFGTTCKLYCVLEYKDGTEQVVSYEGPTRYVSSLANELVFGVDEELVIEGFESVEARIHRAASVTPGDVVDRDNSIRELGEAVPQFGRTDVLLESPIRVESGLVVGFNFSMFGTMRLKMESLQPMVDDSGSATLPVPVEDDIFNPESVLNAHDAALLAKRTKAAFANELAEDGEEVTWTVKATPKAAAGIRK